MYIVSMDEGECTATLYAGTHMVGHSIRLSTKGKATHYGIVGQDGYCLLSRVDLLPTAGVNWLAQIMDGDPS